MHHHASHERERTRFDGPRGRFVRARQFHDRHLHGRHRHGGGRVFDQGDLRLVILKLISSKPAHGYELIKEIEENLGGAYSPSPGVIYPTLTLLEELGYLAPVPSEGPKKGYAITAEGEAHLEQNKAAVDGIFERMAAVAERDGGRRSPKIVRAMENLMLAMKLKLERGKLSEAQIDAVAAALDAAALAIEKD